MVFFSHFPLLLEQTVLKRGSLDVRRATIPSSFWVWEDLHYGWFSVTLRAWVLHLENLCSSRKCLHLANPIIDYLREVHGTSKLQTSEKAQTAVIF